MKESKHQQLKALENIYKPINKKQIELSVSEVENYINLQQKQKINVEKQNQIPEQQDNLHDLFDQVEEESVQATSLLPNSNGPYLSNKFYSNLRDLKNKLNLFQIISLSLNIICTLYLISKLKGLFIVYNDNKIKEELDQINQNNDDIDLEHINDLTQYQQNGESLIYNSQYLSFLVYFSGIIIEITVDCVIINIINLNKQINVTQAIFVFLICFGSFIQLFCIDYGTELKILQTVNDENIEKQSDEENISQHIFFQLLIGSNIILKILFFGFCHYSFINYVKLKYHVQEENNKLLLITQQDDIENE